MLLQDLLLSTFKDLWSLYNMSARFATLIQSLIHGAVIGLKPLLLLLLPPPPPPHIHRIYPIETRQDVLTSGSLPCLVAKSPTPRVVAMDSDGELVTEFTRILLEIWVTEALVAVAVAVVLRTVLSTGIDIVYGYVYIYGSNMGKVMIIVMSILCALCTLFDVYEPKFMELIYKPFGCSSWFVGSYVITVSEVWFIVPAVSAFQQTCLVKVQVSARP